MNMNMLSSTPYTSNTSEARNVYHTCLSVSWRDVTIKSTGVTEKTIGLEQHTSKPKYLQCTTDQVRPIKRIGLAQHCAEHYSLSHVLTQTQSNTHTRAWRWRSYRMTDCVRHGISVYWYTHNTAFSDVIIIWSFIAFKREASALLNEHSNNIEIQNKTLGPPYWYFNYIYIIIICLLGQRDWRVSWCSQHRTKYSPITNERGEMKLTKALKKWATTIIAVAKV